MVGNCLLGPYVAYHFHPASQDPITWLPGKLPPSVERFPVNDRQTMLHVI
jgi:hypothetical protein